MRINNTLRCGIVGLALLASGCRDDTIYEDHARELMQYQEQARQEELRKMEEDDITKVIMEQERGLLKETYEKMYTAQENERKLYEEARKSEGI